MKIPSTLLRFDQHTSLFALLTLGVFLIAPSMADVTDISNQPLANVAGAVAIKPNVMFILDDSGSMGWDYTPDYVSDSKTSLKPKYTAEFGDPPYASPHYNKQYYNPAINYRAAIAFDGGETQGSLSLLPQNRVNTAAWTLVRTDGFNKQNKDQLGATVNNVNIATGYPDRVFCTSTSDSAIDTDKCKTNNIDFRYADGYVSINTSPYTFGLNGSGKPKYRYGAPYYFNILAGEYCSDLDLKTCQTVTPGSSAPSGFPYPAQVRWCTSSTEANASTPTPGACQGRRVNSFTIPRFSGTATANVANGRLTVGDSGSNDSVTITKINVNGINIINTTLTASSGTNSSGERSTLAAQIANAINSFNSTPDYRACAGSSTTAPGCGALPYSGYGLGAINADTVILIPVTTSGGTTPVTDSSYAGYVIDVVAPSNNISASSGTVLVGYSGTGTGNITSITVGPAGGPSVEVLNGGLSNFGSNSPTNRNNAAEAIKTRIGSYTNTTPWEYAARRNVACGGQSAASNRVCIDAPLTAGAQPNDFIITVIQTGGVTTTTTSFSGGVSRRIPTTVTNISAGSGAGSPFQRVDIVPTRTSYPKALGRIDCIVVAGGCSYDEEMTNFANWYTYYRTRNQSMKTAAGHAFQPLKEDFRVGFNTINNTSFNNSTSGGTNWLTVLDNTTTNKNTWYNKLYAASGSSATPLRGALNRMGQYFSGNLTGTESPIQYSCQQNYSILTTDGYWNETYSGIGDRDNVDDVDSYCTRANGCYDGGLGYSNTLSDVAAYYYRTDLRTDLADEVPITTDDPNPAQHMTTFTLGLGVDGVMKYRPDYKTAGTGDYYNIRTGASDCAWASGTCNWPEPKNLDPTAVDDLWHAAVSGHGTYFSAQDPSSLSESLVKALTTLQIRTGAAAASSTSTPNITQEDNLEFSSTFRTVKWDGELVAQHIDVLTGATLPAVIWSAASSLNNKTEDLLDSRTIYTTNATSPGLRAFDWASLSAEEKGWFSNNCAGAGLLAQCPSLSADMKVLANDGEKLLGYLRGQRGYESYTSGSEDPVALFRVRDKILGDIAGSKPAYVSKPRRTYSDSGYASFVSDNKDRAPMIYVGANDGMLHAIDVDNGNEKWAYVPRMLMPDLYELASTEYQSNHRYYVDGSPSVGDVKIAGTWKTILIGGLNKGGRGYYALDVTDPDNPQALWEICSDSTKCPYRYDEDIGYSFGEALITKRPSDGKWVVLVSSGYNNVSPGTGKGYLYVLDAANGTILNKVSTGAGDTTTPSGFAKFADYVIDPDANNTAILLYGGDVLGNLWRFDLATNTVIKLAELTDYAGTPQPITTRPETGKCSATQIVYVGTGRYLGMDDVSDTQLQSVWGIKDGTTSLGVLRTSGSMVEQTLSAISGGYKISNNDVDLSLKNGWFVDLDQNSGERVNLDPLLVNGNLVVVTNQPTSTGSAACGTGGRSFLYQFGYCKGSSADGKADSVMGQLVANSVAVGFSVIGLPSGAVVKVVTADGQKAPPKKLMQTNLGSTSTRRVSWRELTE